MTQTARYFDTVLYTEAEYAEVQNRLLSEGIVRGAGNELAVSAPGGMSVRVASGEVMIEGFWYKSDANVDLTVAANSSGSTRTDAVVLRLNRVTNLVTLVVITNAPAPVRTVGGDWEMQIATIAVPNAAGAITSGMITDVRGGSFCGWTGDGYAPDGTAARPGMAFKGNYGTGWSRGAGANGALQGSISTVLYHYFGTDGYAFATGGGPAGGYNLHTYSGTAGWLNSGPDGVAIYSVLANHYIPASMTKTAWMLLGTSAGQGLGGSGDFNLYTGGSAAGRLLFGTGSVLRMGIAAAGYVNVGANTNGTALFNIMQAANTVGSGLRIYNTNTAVFSDIYNDASGQLAFGVSGTPKVWIANGTGYVSIGSISGTAQFVITQADGTSASQGMYFLLGGGYGRLYSFTDGAFILQSATTAVRLNHATNLFAPNVDNVTALGSAALRWASAAVGGFTMDATNFAPIADNTRSLGTSGLRFANLWVVGSSLGVAAASKLAVSQAAGTNTDGITLQYGGGTSYIYQDTSGNMLFQGAGGAAFGFGVPFNTAAFAPRVASGGSLGTPALPWGTVYCATVIATGVQIGGGSYTGTGIALSADSATKPSTNTWTVSSDIRTKHEASIHEYTGGLEQILALRPVHYRTNGLGGTVDMAEQDEHLIGFVANDVQRVAPELVHRRRGKLHPNDRRDVTLLGINTHAVPFMLINAVKQLQAEIEELRQQIVERKN